MNFLFQLLIYVALAYVQSLFQDKPSAPDKGNPRLPTVSQSRRIPLIVGKSNMEGPNVMDAVPFQTKKIKVSSGGLFGGSSQTVGYRYYQDMEMGLAYGDENAEMHLYELWMGDKLAWEGDVTNNTPFTISKPELFGDSKGPGGVKGTVYFIPGNTAGTVDSAWETQTGRLQPGYPALSRLMFRSGGKGFYWGNSENYPPVTPVYGYFPNPFGHATQHKIGDGCNPAYFLYALNKNPQWGLGLVREVDITAITTMAATLASEGLGFQRTYYDTGAGEVEVEVLAYIDGVRYRDPLTGKTVYKLIRDDYDLESIPTLDEDETVKLRINESGISNTATKVVLDYLDGNADFKQKTITMPNVAARQSLGTDVVASLSTHGAGNSTNAQKIATREALKRTRPRKQGDLICKRTAWDWAPGDTFILSRPSEGIVSLPARVVEHKKGNLKDGKVTIKWVEEVFQFGKAIYTTPTTGTTTFVNDPVDTTVYQSFELPWFMVDTLASQDQRLAILAQQPTGDAFGYRLTAAGTKYDELFDYRERLTLDATLDRQATSVVLDGEVLDLITATQNDVLIDGLNLCLLVGSEGTEIIGYRSWSYSSVNDQTTLSNCYRGLLDTTPKNFSSSENLWLLSDLDVIPSILSESNITYEIHTVTTNGELSNPTDRTHTYLDRYDKPEPPGYVRVNNSFTDEQTIAGDITLSWYHRNRTEMAEDRLYHFFETNSQTLPSGVTYKVKVYDDGSALIHTETGITSTSFVYTLADELADAGSAQTQLGFELFSVNSVGESISYYSYTVLRP